MASDKYLKMFTRAFASMWPGSFDGHGDITMKSIREACIQPFISKDTVAMDIGAGQGRWTEYMVDAKKVYCLDAAAPEWTGFAERITSENVTYIQVEDNTCPKVPNGVVDYVFSYDTFIHFPLSYSIEYMRNLKFRLKKKADLMIHVYDYELASKDTNMADKIIGKSNGTIPTRKEFAEYLDDVEGDKFSAVGRIYAYRIDQFEQELVALGYTPRAKYRVPGHSGRVLHFTVKDERPKSRDNHPRPRKGEGRTGNN
jgi:hypothetical protein